jgi:GMP synthase (glutamine-hydrolysing)
VRVLGEVTRDKLAILRECDEISSRRLSPATSTAPPARSCGAPPVPSVGVMGDYRTYDSVVAITAWRRTSP